jgi:hypothetical protein
MANDVSVYAPAQRRASEMGAATLAVCPRVERGLHSRACVGHRRWLPPPTSGSVVRTSGATRSFGIVEHMDSPGPRFVSA